MTRISDQRISFLRSAFKQLKRDFGLAVIEDTGGFRVGNFYFPFENTEETVLADNLSDEEKRIFQRKKISYLTVAGDVFLWSEDQSLKINQEHQAGDLKSELKFSPTKIISPNGLNILEALYRIPQLNSLGDVGFAATSLSFVKKYRLSQSRLSEIMTGCGADTVLDLKQKIAGFSESWWVDAFEYPGVMKKMKPFSKVMQSYVPLNFEKEFTYLSLISSFSLKEGVDFVKGPSEYAKEERALIDSDVEIWVSEPAAQKIKKSLRLVPSQNRHESKIKLAIAPVDPKTGYLAQALVSPDEYHRHNPFRAIWDLSFGDSRQREVAFTLLRLKLKDFR
jgi:hypothetical protein